MRINVFKWQVRISYPDVKKIIHLINGFQVAPYYWCWFFGALCIVLGGLAFNICFSALKVVYLVIYSKWRKTQTIFLSILYDASSCFVIFAYQYENFRKHCCIYFLALWIARNLQPYAEMGNNKICRSSNLNAFDTR